MLALKMTDLEAICDVAYSISIICNSINDKVRQHKRDQAALLFLAATQISQDLNQQSVLVIKDTKQLVEKEIKKIEMIDFKLRDLVQSVISDQVPKIQVVKTNLKPASGSIATRTKTKAIF